MGHYISRTKSVSYAPNVSAITLKRTKANFLNTHSLKRHHMRVCHAQDTDSHKVKVIEIKDQAV